MNMQRIAFILYNYPLGVSSMLINSIRLFAYKGYKVDIYINKRNLDDTPINFPKDQVTFFVYDDSKQSFIFRCYRFVMRRTGNMAAWFAKQSMFSLCLFLFFPDVYFFSKWLKIKLSGQNYTYIIPVESNSLISLNILKDKKRILYYNLELLDWKKENPLYKNKLLLKHLEFRMIHKLSTVVVPSPLRAKSFSTINEFELHNILILPVAPIGEPITNRRRYFRELFDIPVDSKIVVYSGNFQPWFKCLEIIRSVKDWPKDYALVMHTWNRPVLETKYYKEMTAEAKGLPVYFSTSYIEYEELAAALSSADIGIVFYEAMDDNFTEILYSSNKIGEYLKGGLAIICSDFPSLKAFTEDNAIGLSIPVHELSLAVKQVGEKIEVFKKNALACYQEKFRFESHFERFYQNLINRSE